MKKISFSLLLCILMISCGSEDDFVLDVPAHFTEPNIPEDNQLTLSRVQLGETLFFDTALSIDSSISCASCHHPKNAFSDTVRLSKGVNGSLGKRNAPSLVNIVYAPRLFRDGGVPSLEHQVISPIENPAEMNFQLQAVAERLSKNDIYQQMSIKAYNRSFSPYVLVRALAAYQRTLIGGNSRYDQFFYQNKKEQLSKAEQRGMQLFFGQQTNCSQCHSGVLLTNFDYENNGLHKEYTDIGRAGVSILEEDKYKFKIPSLRNIALTAPYMHDGSIETLEEVIEHYNKGGKKHPNQHEYIQPLGLTEEEKRDLIAFLQSLTDNVY